MAIPHDGSQQRYGLLGKFLALRDALRWRQRPRRSLVILTLFTIELGPLGLVAGLKQGANSGSHRLILRRYSESTASDGGCKGTRF
jgi:hypothetical protein